MNVELLTLNGASGAACVGSSKPSPIVANKPPGKGWIGSQVENRITGEIVAALRPFFPGSEYRTDGDGNRDGLLLDASGEYRLYISYLSMEHRIKIGGGWPSATDRAQYTPYECDKRESGYNGPITVSASKSAAQVARDIHTRFLPQYKSCFAKCKARRDADLKFASDGKALAAELGAALQVQPWQRQQDSWAVDLAEPLSGFFEVNGQHASATLRGLTREQALRLCAFLGKELNA